MNKKKHSEKTLSKGEAEARKQILEELFYDFSTSRAKVFWMNFFRGIFFGVGSVIGGTIVVTLVVYILSLLVDIPGGIGEGVQFLIQTVETES